ncbi:winged helix-turn-helix transcriptional regulator [Bifidobacterium bombi]|nr:helix-turn-helix domain-containing protein [Bifidobacterium bombi]
MEVDEVMSQTANVKYDVFSSQCPSRALLNDVTSRWSILVLTALRENDARFSQIRRKVDGISDRMLSYTLSLLVEDKLVENKSEGRSSLYSLTDAGRIVADKSLDMIQSLYSALDCIA